MPTLSVLVVSDNRQPHFEGPNYWVAGNRASHPIAGSSVARDPAMTVVLI
jgi:hypothetical protein